MTIKVSVKTDKTSTLMKSIEEFTLDEANDFIEDLYTEVKAKTPVDTGRAKNSWQTKEVTRVGEIGQVGNPQDYVKYLEDGTIHIAPQKFITSSIIRQLNKRR